MRKNRIESIDFLRGLVMIIMALDHVRDYFFFGSFTSNPTDLDSTTPLLFYTRIITHYCAPVFVLLTELQRIYMVQKINVTYLNSY